MKTLFASLAAMAAVSGKIVINRPQALKDKFENGEI